MAIYIYSDPHFYDENIMNWCERPFSSVEEMNETLVYNYNLNVNKYDVVYFLGDLFPEYISMDLAEKISKQLKGIKILIKGNHDNFGNEFYRSIGFTKVFNTFHYINFDSYHINLVHDPAMAQNKDSIWVSGHLHRIFKCISTNYNTLIINASVEMWDYSPIHIDKITDIIDHYNIQK